MEVPKVSFCLSSGYLPTSVKPLPRDARRVPLSTSVLSRTTSPPFCIWDDDVVGNSLRVQGAVGESSLKGPKRLGWTFHPGTKLVSFFPSRLFHSLSLLYLLGVSWSTPPWVLSLYQSCSFQVTSGGSLLTRLDFPGLCTEQRNFCVDEERSVERVNTSCLVC